MPDTDKALDEKVPSSTDIAVSVIIPVYNAEEYLGECIDSILAQTFKNFELILVDDCSTDSSYAIAESYIPKFNGRLKLYRTPKNSGNGVIARNIGLTYASGEYVYNMDNDDLITKTALEEMYTLAKEYDADIVYCERYYMSTGVGEEFIKNIHPATRKVQPPPYVNEPTLESDDLSERLQKILDKKFWAPPWLKLVRRELLNKHEITFPVIKISDDDIWTYRLLFLAKNVLRVPNMIYIRRMREDSITGVRKTPQQTINFWLNPILLGLKELDKFMNQIPFFQENPQKCYAILEKFFKGKLWLSLTNVEEISSAEVYESIKNEFGKRLGEFDVLILAFYTYIYEQNKVLKTTQQKLKEIKNSPQKSQPFLDKKISPEFLRFITARIDIRLESETPNADLKIFSVSDDKAEIIPSENFNEGDLVYQIHSYAGNLGFTVKANASGKIILNLRSMNVHNPKNKFKRIPYWIDYTALTVNDRRLIKKLTPVWHDKPRKYVIDVEAEEKVRIQVAWLPHRSDIVEQAVPKINNDIISVPINFRPFVTARADIKFSPQTPEGNLQVSSLSDESATITKPSWFQHNGSGYVITSLSGTLSFIIKSTTDGQFKLNLKGISVMDSENESKRIPYWIDYTKLIVNDRIIFDALTPAWHDKPYTYTDDIKAGEEVKISFEWLPHRSDT